MTMDSLKNRVEVLKPMLTDFVAALENLHDIKQVFKTFSDIHLHDYGFEGNQPPTRNDRSFVGYMLASLLTEEEAISVTSDIKFTVIKSILEKLQIEGVDTQKVVFKDVGFGASGCFSPTFILHYEEIPIFWFDLREMKQFYENLNGFNHSILSSFLFEKEKQKTLNSLEIAARSIESNETKLNTLLQLSSVEDKEKRMIRKTKKEIADKEQRIAKLNEKLLKHTSFEPLCVKIISILEHFIKEQFETN